MRKNLLALSIAAMVGGLSGAANAAVTTDTVSVLTGGRLLSNNIALSIDGFSSTFLNSPAQLAAKGTTGTAAITAVNTLPQTTGVGHILFVPYFTTQGTNATLLNLVNTDTKNGKAVKLRFRGAANSDDLFDISIFLSPGDMWTANISANGDVSALTTTDNTCTLPSASEIKETFGKFKLNRVNNDVTQTREGYIEILNMADVPPTRILNDVDKLDADLKAAHNSANPLFTATKHVKNAAGKMEAPCTQAVMDQQATPLEARTGNDPALRGYSWPTGGLMANWIIVNVADKASFSGPAVAVTAVGFDGFGVVRPAAANLVWSPQTATPIEPFQAVRLSADPLFGTNNADGKFSTGGRAYVRAASYDFPDLSTPYAGGTNFTPSAQANSVTADLATLSVTNEFLTEQTVQFATDWVFSMPTRRYAMALDYDSKSMVENNENNIYNVNGNVIDAVGTGFNNEINRSNYFRSTGNRVNTVLNPAKTRICVDSTALVAFDREESTRTSFVISPDSLIQFCGETTVLTFNSATYSVLGAALATMNVETKFVDGWFRIDTPGIGRGLPVVGFAAAKLRGANMGGTWTHRTQR